MIVRFSKTHPDAVTPSYAKEHDAAMDLTAISMKYVRDDNVDFYEYDFGLIVEVPPGHFGLICPRSSITKTDLFLSNSPGILDAGYRGKLTARFRKTTGSPHTYKVGERVCQLLILPYPQITLIETDFDSLTKTQRNTGGFGSSGL